MAFYDSPEVNTLLSQKKVIGLHKILASHQQDSVRAEAAQALGEIADPRSVKPLISALIGASSRVRVQATAALINIGDPAVSALIPLIMHADDEIGELAAKALGEIGNKDAVEPLINALANKTRNVRRYAAVALGNLGDSRAIEPLKNALNDANMYVRTNVGNALYKLDPD